VTECSPIVIDYRDYRRRVAGCWLGKAIGGTLGQPHEGKPGPLSLTFYDPVPMGVIPNDDLDLQLVWLELVRRYGPGINRIHLAGGWLEHVDFPWDEYGFALANLARGIFPPASGHHRNFCGDCMGAPIRSEIWAALAPGDPSLACRLAYEDAIVDHDGEGIWGELFLAAVESAAFVVNDRDRLLNIGLSVIPSGCRIAQAVRSTITWYACTNDRQEVRENILDKFGHENFTDAPQNIAFIVLGWLAGRDFADAICTAVNCGLDTDCTGASLGSILGIIDPEGIPGRWKEPISDRVVVSAGIKNLNPPATIDELTDLTVSMAEQMLNARSDRARISRTGEGSRARSVTYDLQPFELEPSDSMLVADGNLRIVAVYPEGLSFVPGKALPVILKFSNSTNTPVDADLHLRPPAGWSISAGEAGRLHLEVGGTQAIRVNVSPPGSAKLHYASVNLHVVTSGISADYHLSLVGSWPWKVLGNGSEQIMWQPERTLLPLRNGNVSLSPGNVFRASSSFHLSRRQYVRVILASNGSGKLELDGEEVINYGRASFFPMVHRPAKGTFYDVVLGAGRHGVELSMRFHRGNPRAALLLGDAHDHQLIHDVTFSL